MPVQTGRTVFMVRLKHECRGRDISHSTIQTTGRKERPNIVIIGTGVTWNRPRSHQVRCSNEPGVSELPSTAK